MRKGIMTNPTNNDEKVAASNFSIEVHHKNKRVVNLNTVQYTYEDVFEYIKEQYEEDLDAIQKVIIELEK